MRANEFGSTRARASISSEPNKASDQPHFFPLALAGEAGLLLLAWGLARWLDVSPAAYLRLTPEAVLWGLLATAPLLLGLVWLLTSTAAPVRGLVDFVTDQIGPLVSRCTPLQLACLAATAGISEEVLFRGVLQVGLSAWLPETGALVMASAAFGLVHAATRVYAVFAGVVGLYLGGLFLWQSSLIPPILAHGLYDLVALNAVATRYRNAQR